MSKRAVFVITALSLVVLLAMTGGVALAGHKIQDTGSGTVTLDREDGAPEQATGEARFTLTDETGGYHKLATTLEIKKLLPKSGNVYQAWLRDKDKDYSDALVTFQTDRDGDRTVTVKGSVPHFAEYDEIVVTGEEKHDEDPTLSGEVVLRGNLAH